MKRKLRLYLVTLNNHDYDQYDAFVVAATSPERAVELMQHINPERNTQYGFQGLAQWHSGYTVAEIVPTEEGEILGSFNAG